MNKHKSIAMNNTIPSLNPPLRDNIETGLYLQLNSIFSREIQWTLMLKLAEPLTRRLKKDIK